ncbi:MAG: AAA family ATPase [Deltaproteobacteria bacterium]|nr:AAA family ATPase [Deltaproteobacteria bacterium]
MSSISDWIPEEREEETEEEEEIEVEMPEEEEELDEDRRVWEGMSDKAKKRLLGIAEKHGFSEEDWREVLAAWRSARSKSRNAAEALKVFPDELHKLRAARSPESPGVEEVELEELPPLQLKGEPSATAPPSPGAATSTAAQAGKTVATARTARSAMDRLAELAGDHLVEIYGVMGTGKSRLVHAIAVEAQEAGKRVLYIDTEGGLDEKHIRQLKNYVYIGDDLADLRAAVEEAKRSRERYDVLVVDSVGHPVYVNYVTMGGMDAKLKSYQELAAVFADMVRFSRGERAPRARLIHQAAQRQGGGRLAIAVNHTVSEFTRIAKDLPEEAPLDPFGGQIHRVPKLILRSEPVEYRKDRSVFRLVTWKARDLPKNLEVARFTIDARGVRIDWQI